MFSLKEDYNLLINKDEVGLQSRDKDVVILHSPGETGRCNRHERKQHLNGIVLSHGFSASDRNGWCKKRSHKELLLIFEWSVCYFVGTHAVRVLSHMREETKTLPCSSQCQTSKCFMAEDRIVCIWHRGKLRHAKAVGFVCELAGNGSQGWITENRLHEFSESSPAGCVAWLTLRGWQDPRAQLKHWNYEFPSFQIFG